MVKDGQNLYDYTVEQTGSISNFINLVKLNNRNVDDDLTSGEELSVPVADDAVEEYEIYKQNIQNVKKCRDNQGLLDLTVQYFGGVEYLFTFLTDNGLNLNSNLKSGLELTINNTNFGNEIIKRMFTKAGQYPSNYQDQPSEDIVPGDYNDDYNDDYY